MCLKRFKCRSQNFVYSAQVKKTFQIDLYLMKINILEMVTDKG